MNENTTASTIAGGLLRELATACQAAALYPAGHPHRTELGVRLATQVTALRDAVGRDPTLFADRSGFYLDTTLLVHESLTLGRLAESMADAGLESLTFTPHTSAHDLDALVELLHGERDRSNLGGVKVNAVRASDDDTPPWRRRMADLRRAYSAGVGVLRESSARAARGEAIDLDVADRVVGQIADDVSRDPGYGLLLSAVKSYDEYTYIHMVNVCVMSVALGQVIGLRPDQVRVLGVGALLHDIGKVFVPGDVLHAPGTLDEEQWRLVQRHPVDGAGLFFATGPGLYHPAASILLEHHAAYDASGYPTLHGHGPSVPSRLVAVADSFDAITSKRSYREPLGRHKAMEILRAGAGHHLDPAAVRAFGGLLGDHPIGSVVRLDSGETAVVVRQHDQHPGQPTVLVLLDRTGTPGEVEERDLAVADSGVVDRVDAAEVDIDITRFILEGEVHQASRAGDPGGLVHEPSPGEEMPDGYTPTHDHHDGHRIDGVVDPDIAPAI